MLAKRIIPCLDVDNGRVVKGTNFVHIQDAGDPVNCAKVYNEAGADELVFLDITASSSDRNTFFPMVKRVAQECFIPLTVGGGIRSLADIDKALAHGADKVAINTAAFKEPELIDQAAKHFGSQCIVVALDAKREKKGHWGLYSHGGRNKIYPDAICWAKEMAQRGAGEILLTSMDGDGTHTGYDIALTKAVSNAVSIPVIASGGAGNLEHLAEVLTLGYADAALAAGIFHFGKYTIKEAKSYLASQQITIRNCY